MKNRYTQKKVAARRLAAILKMKTDNRKSRSGKKKIRQSRKGAVFTEDDVKQDGIDQDRDTLLDHQAEIQRELERRESDTTWVFVDYS